MKDLPRQTILTSTDRKADERQQRDRKIYGLRLSEAERRWCCIENSTVTGLNYLSRNSWCAILDRINQVEAHPRRYGSSKDWRRGVCRNVRRKVQAAMATKPEAL